MLRWAINLVILISCLIGISQILSPSPTFAMIPPQSEVLPQIVDPALIKEYRFTEDNIKEIIPTNMKPSDNQGTVAREVFDHSLQSYLASPAVQRSSMAKAAKTVENSLKADVTVEDRSEGIQHVFSFQMLAFQSIAMVKYRGLMNAQIAYKIGEPDYNLEMKRKLDTRTNLVLSHSYDPLERMDKLSFQWDW